MLTALTAAEEVCAATNKLDEVNQRQPERAKYPEVTPMPGEME